MRKATGSEISSAWILCLLVTGCAGELGKVHTEMDSGVEDRVEPINNLPNPYERIEPWADLPQGMSQWPQVTGTSFLAPSSSS